MTSRELIYTWTIENYFYCRKKKREYLRTPIFQTRLTDESKWHLRLYPRGKDMDNFVAFYLHRERVRDGDTTAFVYLNFELSILDSDGNKDVWKYYPNSGFLPGFCAGCSNFKNFFDLYSKRDLLALNGDLTLQCRLFHPSSDFYPDLTEHYLITTQIDIERHVLTWDFEDFNRWDGENILCGSIISNTKVETTAEGSDLVSMKLYEVEGHIGVLLSFGGQNVLPFSGTAEISVIGFDGLSKISKKERLLIMTDRRHPAFYKFPTFINRSMLQANNELYLPNNKLVILGDFQFAVGDVTHKNPEYVAVPLSLLSNFEGLLGRSGPKKETPCFSVSSSVLGLNQFTSSIARTSSQMTQTSGCISEPNASNFMCDSSLHSVTLYTSDTSDTSESCCNYGVPLCSSMQKMDDQTSSHISKTSEYSPDIDRVDNYSKLITLPNTMERVSSYFETIMNDEDFYTEMLSEQLNPEDVGKSSQVESFSSGECDAVKIEGVIYIKQQKALYKSDWGVTNCQVTKVVPIDQTIAKKINPNEYAISLKINEDVMDDDVVDCKRPNEQSDVVKIDRIVKPEDQGISFKISDNWIKVDVETDKEATLQNDANEKNPQTISTDASSCIIDEPYIGNVEVPPVQNEHRPEIQSLFPFLQIFPRWATARREALQSVPESIDDCELPTPFKVLIVLWCMVIFLALPLLDRKEVSFSQIQGNDTDKVLALLYAESLGDVHWARMARAYSVADVYSIKSTSSSNIKSSLTVDNVWSALTLAEAHQDSDLLKTVEEFFLNYQNDTLLSDAWKTAVEDQMALVGAKYIHMNFDKLRQPTEKTNVCSGKEFKFER